MPFIASLGTRACSSSKGSAAKRAQQRHRLAAERTGLRAVEERFRLDVQPMALLVTGEQIGDERVLMTGSPPGHERYFEELAAMTSGSTPDTRAIGELRQRYDTDQLAGPMASS